MTEHRLAPMKKLQPMGHLCLLSGRKMHPIMKIVEEVDVPRQIMVNTQPVALVLL